MSNVFLTKEKQEIVRNLIETCGAQRAMHAARQFGWHDIATEILNSLPKEKAAAKH